MSWKDRAKPINTQSGGESSWRSRAQAVSPGFSKVIQEQHPDVTTAMRAIVKNFANSPESGVKYLKQELPGHEVDYFGGQYRVRKPGEKDYRVVDPDTGIFSKDILSDALDIAYDVPAGALEGAAAAGGATVGSVLPGAGTLAGAAVGGGLASAGDEALRQKLGAWLGIPQEVDTTDVLVSGGLGAGGGLLMGGGGAKAAAKKAFERALGKGASKEAAEIAAKKAGRVAQGLISDPMKGHIMTGALGLGAGGKAIDELNGGDTNFGGYLAGAGALAGLGYGPLRAAIPWIGEKISGAPRTAIRGLIERFPEVQEMNKTGVTDMVEKANQRLVSTLDNQVNTKGKELMTAIENTGGQVDMTKVKAPLLDEIDRLKAQYAMNPTSANREKVDAAEGAFNDLFKYESTASETNPLTLTKKHAPTEVPNQVSPMTAWQMQEDLADYADFSKTANPAQRVNSKATRSEKMLAGKAAQSYGNINDQLDALSEGASGDLKRQYKELLDTRKSVYPHFKTPEKTWMTLSNMDTKSRQLLREKLAKLDKAHGLGLNKDAELLETYAYFGRPGLDPISSGATTSTSRTIPLSVAGGSLGSLLGYKLGGGYSGAAVGGGLGAALGSTLGSPAAMRGGIGAMLAAEAKVNGVKQAIKSVAMKTGLPESELLKAAAQVGLTTQGGKSIYEKMSEPNFLMGQ